VRQLAREPQPHGAAASISFGRNPPREEHEDDLACRLPCGSRRGRGRRVRPERAAVHPATIGGQAYNLVEGTVLPTSVEDSNTVAGSLIRNPDGNDTNDAAADWAFTTTVTRGAANVLTP
jgi:hypothetical protein